MIVRTLVLVFVLSFATRASAQSSDADHAAALALMQTGVQAAQEGNWEAARDAFAQAFSLVTSTRVLMNLAGAQRHTGHLLDAAASYRQWRTLATDRDEPFRPEVEDALAQLERETPQLRILVEGVAPGDTIALDGEPVAQEDAIPVDPGEHIVSVSRDGGALRTETIELAASDRRAVTIEVPSAVTEPPPPPIPARSIFTERPTEDIWSSPWIWVGIGAGAAVILGVIIGIAVAASSGGGSSVPDMGTLGPYHL